MVAIFYITLNKYQPCVCREHDCLRIQSDWDLGAPLRVQGTHIRHDDDHYSERSTPACAGNTEYKDKNGQQIREHPCVCREHSKNAPRYQPY